MVKIKRRIAQTDEHNDNHNEYRSSAVCPQSSAGVPLDHQLSDGLTVLVDPEHGKVHYTTKSACDDNIANALDDVICHSTKGRIIKAGLWRTNSIIYKPPQNYQSRLIKIYGSSEATDDLLNFPDKRLQNAEEQQNLVLNVWLDHQAKTSSNVFKRLPQVRPKSDHPSDAYQFSDEPVHHLLHNIGGVIEKTLRSSESNAVKHRPALNTVKYPFLSSLIAKTTQKTNSIRGNHSLHTKPLSSCHKSVLCEPSTFPNRSSINSAKEATSLQANDSQLSSVCNSTQLSSAYNNTQSCSAYKSTHLSTTGFFNPEDEIKQPQKKTQKTNSIRGNHSLHAKPLSSCHKSVLSEPSTFPNRSSINSAKEATSLQVNDSQSSSAYNTTQSWSTYKSTHLSPTVFFNSEDEIKQPQEKRKKTNSIRGNHSLHTNSGSSCDKSVLSKPSTFPNRSSINSAKEASSLQVNDSQSSSAYNTTQLCTTYKNTHHSTREFFNPEDEIKQPQHKTWATSCTQQRTLDYMEGLFDFDRKWYSSNSISRNARTKAVKKRFKFTHKSQDMTIPMVRNAVSDPRSMKNAQTYAARSNIKDSNSFESPQCDKLLVDADKHFLSPGQLPVKKPARKYSSVFASRKKPTPSAPVVTCKRNNCSNEISDDPTVLSDITIDKFNEVNAKTMRVDKNLELSTHHEQLLLPSDASLLNDWTEGNGHSGSKLPSALLVNSCRLSNELDEATTPNASKSKERSAGVSVSGTLLATDNSDRASKILYLPQRHCSNKLSQVSKPILTLPMSPIGNGSTSSKSSDKPRKQVAVVSGFRNVFLSPKNLESESDQAETGKNSSVANYGKPREQTSDIDNQLISSSTATLFTAMADGHKGSASSNVGITLIKPLLVKPENSHGPSELPKTSPRKLAAEKGNGMMTLIGSSRKRVHSSVSSHDSVADGYLSQSSSDDVYAISSPCTSDVEMDDSSSDSVTEITSVHESVTPVTRHSNECLNHVLKHSYVKLVPLRFLIQHDSHSNNTKQVIRSGAENRSSKSSVRSAGNHHNSDVKYLKYAVKAEPSTRYANDMASSYQRSFTAPNQRIKSESLPDNNSCKTRDPFSKDLRVVCKRLNLKSVSAILEQPRHHSKRTLNSSRNSHETYKHLPSKSKQPLCKSDQLADLIKKEPVVHLPRLPVLRR